MTLIALAAALVMGLVLGLLGGGGSILAVPILVFLVGLDTKEAIATSLLVVGATSALAAIQHARNGNVAWGTAGTFGVFAMGGAFLGGLAAAYISGDVLFALFAVLMVVTAVAMLRKKNDARDEDETEPTDTPDPQRRLPLMKIAGEGLVVGGVTGLVGAGGGFLVVPALVLLGRLPMRLAVGTSLVIIFMKSMAAFAGYAGHVSVDPWLVATFVGAAVVGSLGGAQLTRVISAQKLRASFAYFVLAMGAYIISGQVGLIPTASSHGKATAHARH